MGKNTYEIQWRSAAVAKLMRDNNITTRGVLASRLGASRSTVYASFDENWAGTPSVTLLAQVAGHFRVPLSALVTEPAGPRRHPRQIDQLPANVRILRR